MNNPPSPATSSIPTYPLLIWVIPQLLALTIGVSRVSLWARYPQPGELMSLRLLLTAQIAMASLLFPILLRDRGSLVAVIASGWPLALIAGSLSATPLGMTLGSETFVAGWLLALACIHASVSSRPATRLVIAIASLWTIGGPVLLYLREEFADQRPPLSAPLAGPIVAVQSYLNGDGGLLVPSLYFAAILVLAIAITLLRRASSSLHS